MKLDQFMDEECLSLSKMAEMLEKPVSTVHGWKSGRRVPSAPDLVRIEMITRGAVTVHDFVRAKAAA